MTEPQTVQVSSGPVTWGSQRDAPARRSWWLDGSIAAVFVLTVLAIAAPELSGVSLWHDEAFTAGEVALPFGTWIHVMTRLEPNMAGYQMGLRAWLFLTQQAAPQSEFVLRLPSLAMAAFAAGFVYILARQVWGRLSAASAASLFVFNPLALTYATEARSYSLEVLLTCVSWFALLNAGIDSRRRWWIIYVFATAAGLYAHLFTVFLVAAQAVFVACLALRLRRREPPLRIRPSMFGAGLLAIAGLCLPLLVAAATHEGHAIAWVQPANTAAIGRFLRYLSGSAAYGLVLLTLPLMAIGVYVLMSSNQSWRAYLARWFRRERGKAVQLGGWWMLALVVWITVPLIATLASALGPIHLFVPRYLLPIVPAICLLGGAGVALFKSQAAKAGALVAIVVAGALGLPGYYASRQMQDYVTPASWVRSHYQPDAGLVCLRFCFGWDYYLARDPTLAPMGRNFPGKWQWATGGQTGSDQAALEKYTASHGRIFLVDTPLQVTFSNAAVRERVRFTRAWLDSHYRLEDKFVARGPNGAVTVELYMPASG